mmetsp:Transcript_144701/g.463703  ORF Transcript_144701/g.463703 Transcript_144701/m.463703 type:complete len:201 (-) Transcript_144701:5-607(-)
MLVPISVQVNTSRADPQAEITSLDLAAGDRVAVHHNLELAVLQDGLGALCEVRLAAQRLDEVQTRLRRDQLPGVLAKEQEVLVGGAGAGRADGHDVDVPLRDRLQGHAWASSCEALQLIADGIGGVVERKQFRHRIGGRPQAVRLQKVPQSSSFHLLTSVDRDADSVSRGQRRDKACELGGELHLEGKGTRQIRQSAGLP